MDGRAIDRIATVMLGFAFLRNGVRDTKFLPYDGETGMDAYEALVTRVSPIDIGDPAPDEETVARSWPPRFGRRTMVGCILGASFPYAERADSALAMFSPPPSDAAIPR